MDTPLKKRALQVLAVASLSLGLDQFSKYWLLYEAGLIDGPPIVLTSFFSLVMVWNKGVSFGILSRSGADWGPILLIVVAVVISAVLLRLALRSPHRWERIGYGMVIGGAMGNVIDRLRVGAVADFFYLHVGELGWPAFNVADSAIFVGVCILLLTMFKNPKMPA